MGGGGEVAQWLAHQPVLVAVTDLNLSKFLEIIGDEKKIIKEQEITKNYYNNVGEAVYIKYCMINII